MDCSVGGFAMRQLDPVKLDSNRCHRVLDAIYREDHNQTRDRISAANHSILRRMALNAHNRMPYEGKKRKSLPKRELRAAHDTPYLEQLLSLVLGPWRDFPILVLANARQGG